MAMDDDDNDAIDSSADPISCSVLLPVKLLPPVPVAVEDDDDDDC